MPYIEDHSRRCELTPTVVAESSGELNYQITASVLAYLDQFAFPHYEDFNTAMGALECAKQELYRRKIAPYEDTKKMMNGDVYG